MCGLLHAFTKVREAHICMSWPSLMPTQNAPIVGKKAQDQIPVFLNKTASFVTLNARYSSLPYLL